MKKILAVLFAVVLVFSLATTAMAYTSPSGEKYFKVTIVNGTKTQPVAQKVLANGTIELTSNSKYGTFNGWKFYTANKQLAVLGTDYEFVSGDANSSKATVKLLTDGLIICANYNGVETKPIEVNEYVSPKTGDSFALVLFGIMSLTLAGAFVAKKQLVK